jgi:hypothetical protein
VVGHERLPVLVTRALDGGANVFPGQRHRYFLEGEGAQDNAWPVRER